MLTAVLLCAAGRAGEEDGGSLKRKASRPHMIPRFGDPLSMRQPRAGKQAGLCSVLLEDSTPGLCSVPGQVERPQRFSREAQLAN